MYKVLKYSFFDLLRSRWSVVYFLFYAISTTVLLYLSNDASKLVVSLMNITLILTPLIGSLFGVINYYNSREFVELLLAQPIPRKSIFAGMYLGISTSLTVSFLLGLLLPMLIFGTLFSSHFTDILSLIITGVFLTFIFTGLAFMVAMFNENRLKGFGLTIIIWLFMVFIYDAIFLLSLLLFESYPLEKFSIALSMFNPIDLSRILIMLKLDISALMGYTGAVFNKFFGTSMGIMLSLGALVFWAIWPLLVILMKSRKKDF